LARIKKNDDKSHQAAENIKTESEQNLEENLKRAGNIYSAIREQNRNKIKEQKADYERKLSNKESTIKALAERNQGLQEQLDEAARLASLASEFQSQATANLETERQETADLKKTIEENQREINDLERDLGGQKNHNYNLGIELDGKKQSLGRLQNENEELRQRTGEFETKDKTPELLVPLMNRVKNLEELEKIIDAYKANKSNTESTKEITSPTTSENRTSKAENSNETIG